MIETVREDAITTLRLAHGKASALDVELLDALQSSLDEVERSDARAVVLTGTGSIFSAGVDLFRIVDGGEEYIARFLPALSEAVTSRKGAVASRMAVTSSGVAAEVGAAAVTSPTARDRLMAHRAAGGLTPPPSLRRSRSWGGPRARGCAG